MMKLRAMDVQHHRAQQQTPQQHIDRVAPEGESRAGVDMQDMRSPADARRCQPPQQPQLCADPLCEAAPNGGGLDIIQHAQLHPLPRLYPKHPNWSRG
jgi:hypothetical protein